MDGGPQAHPESTADSDKDPQSKPIRQKKQISLQRQKKLADIFWLKWDSLGKHKQARILERIEGGKEYIWQRLPWIINEENIRLVYHYNAIGKSRGPCEPDAYFHLISQMMFTYGDSRLPQLQNIWRIARLTQLQLIDFIRQSHMVGVTEEHMYQVHGIPKVTYNNVIAFMAKLCPLRLRRLIRYSMVEQRVTHEVHKVRLQKTVQYPEHRLISSMMETCPPSVQQFKQNCPVLYNALSKVVEPENMILFTGKMKKEADPHLHRMAAAIQQRNMQLSEDDKEAYDCLRQLSFVSASGRKSAKYAAVFHRLLGQPPLETDLIFVFDFLGRELIKEITYYAMINREDVDVNESLQASDYERGIAALRREQNIENGNLLCGSYTEQFPNANFLSDHMDKKDKTWADLCAEVSNISFSKELVRAATATKEHALLIPPAFIVAAAQSAILTPEQLAMRNGGSSEAIRQRENEREQLRIERHRRLVESAAALVAASQASTSHVEDPEALQYPSTSTINENNVDVEPNDDVPNVGYSLLEQPSSISHTVPEPERPERQPSSIASPPPQPHLAANTEDYDHDPDIDDLRYERIDEDTDPSRSVSPVQPDEEGNSSSPPLSAEDQSIESTESRSSSPVSLRSLSSLSEVSEPSEQPAGMTEVEERELLGLSPPPPNLPVSVPVIENVAGKVTTSEQPLAPSTSTAIEEEQSIASKASVDIPMQEEIPDEPMDTRPAPVRQKPPAVVRKTEKRPPTTSSPVIPTTSGYSQPLPEELPAHLRAATGKAQPESLTQENPSNGSSSSSKPTTKKKRTWTSMLRKDREYT